jgi:hypothetical protein
LIPTPIIRMIPSIPTIIPTPIIIRMIPTIPTPIIIRMIPTIPTPIIRMIPVKPVPTIIPTPIRIIPVIYIKRCINKIILINIYKSSCCIINNN